MSDANWAAFDDAMTRLERDAEVRERRQRRARVAGPPAVMDLVEQARERGESFAPPVRLGTPREQAEGVAADAAARARDNYSGLNEDWGWLDLTAGFLSDTGQGAADVVMSPFDDGARNRARERGERWSRAADGMGSTVLSDATLGDFLEEWSAGEEARRAAGQEPFDLGNMDLIDTFWRGHARHAREARGEGVYRDALADFEERDAELRLEAGQPFFGSRSRAERNAADDAFETDAWTTGSGALELIPGVGLIDIPVSLGRAGARAGLRAAGQEVPEMLARPARLGETQALDATTQTGAYRGDRNAALGAVGVGAGYEALDGEFGDDPIAAALVGMGSVAALRNGLRTGEAVADGALQARRLGEVEPIDVDAFPAFGAPDAVARRADAPPPRMPARNFQAAIRDPETGQVYTGMDHVDAIESVADDAVRARLDAIYRAPTEDAASVGFVVNGQFMGREEGLAAMRASRDQARGVRIGEQLNRDGTVTPATPIDHDAPDVRLRGDLGMDENGRFIAGAGAGALGGAGIGAALNSEAQADDGSQGDPLGDVVVPILGPAVGAATIGALVSRGRGRRLGDAAARGADDAAAAGAEQAPPGTQALAPDGGARGGENDWQAQLRVGQVQDGSGNWAVFDQSGERQSDHIFANEMGARAALQNMQADLPELGNIRMLPDGDFGGREPTRLAQPAPTAGNSATPLTDMFDGSVGMSGGRPARLGDPLDGVEANSRLNGAGQRTANEGGTDADFLSALPTNPEQWREAMALHPWINSPSRAQAVIMASARNADGSFVYPTSDILNATGMSSENSLSVTLNKARAAGVPVPHRRSGPGGSTAAPGGDRIARVLDIMESAERNGVYLTSTQIAERAGISQASVETVLSQVRSNRGGRHLPDSARERLAALDVAREARRGFSVRKNKSGAAAAGIGVGAGGLGLAAWGDAEAQESGEIIERDGILIDPSSQTFPSERDAVNREVVGDMYIQDYADGSRHVFRVNREGERPVIEYLGAYAGENFETPPVGDYYTNPYDPGMASPAPDRPQESDGGEGVLSRAAPAMIAGLGGRYLGARLGARGAALETSTFFPAWMTDVYRSGTDDLGGSGLAGLAPVAAAHAARLGVPALREASDDLAATAGHYAAEAGRDGAGRTRLDYDLLADPEFIARQRAFSRELPMEGVRARRLEADDPMRSTPRMGDDMPLEDGRLSPYSEFMAASPTEQLLWMDRLGFDTPRGDASRAELGRLVAQRALADDVSNLPALPAPAAASEAGGPPPMRRNFRVPLEDVSPRTVLQRARTRPGREVINNFADQYGIPRGRSDTETAANIKEAALRDQRVRQAMRDWGMAAVLLSLGLGGMAMDEASAAPN